MSDLHSLGYLVTGALMLCTVGALADKSWKAALLSGAVYLGSIVLFFGS